MITAVPSGVLLPESALASPWVQVLAVFVAINTLMYAAIAVAKVLPKIHWGDWFGGSYGRAQSRSIYVAEPEIGPPPVVSPLDGDPANWQSLRHRTDVARTSSRWS